MQDARRRGHGDEVGKRKEDRGQRTEDREQRSENRWQRARGRELKSEVGPVVVR